MKGGVSERGYSLHLDHGTYVEWTLSDVKPSIATWKSQVEES